MPSSSVADVLPALAGLRPELVVPRRLESSICSRASPIPTARPTWRSISLSARTTAGPITEIIPAPGVQVPPSLLPLDRPARIKLLHFNDFHSHISSFTTQGNVPVFSRIASWACEERAPAMRPIRRWLCWLHRAAMRAGGRSSTCAGGGPRVVPGSRRISPLLRSGCRCGGARQP